jgi:3-hydroxyacyl-[acyl-carrier-protein] dehydratase
MKYTGKEIYNVIPNRYPLMLLETLTVEDNNAVSEINLKGDEWFFECHYPDFPVMPLSLLIESMSQTFSSIFLQRQQTLEIPAFSSIGGNEKISLKDKLVPGDSVRIEATLKSFKRGIAKGVCRAFKNHQPNNPDNQEINGGGQPIIEFEIVEVLPSQMIRMR